MFCERIVTQRLLSQPNGVAHDGTLAFLSLLLDWSRLPVRISVYVGLLLLAVFLRLVSSFGSMILKRAC